MSKTLLFTAALLLTLHCSRSYAKTCNFCLEKTVTGTGADVARSEILSKDAIVSCESPTTVICNATRGEDTCKQMKSSVKVTGKLGEVNMDIEFSLKRQMCMNSTMTCNMVRQNAMKLQEMVMGIRDPKMGESMMNGQGGNGMNDGLDNMDKERLQRMMEIRDLELDMQSCEMTALSGTKMMSAGWLFVAAILAMML